MSVSFIQSSTVPFYVSTDGITYKMIVCKRGLTGDFNTPTTVEDSDCGPVAGLGSNQWAFTIDAIANMNPDIGTSESYEQLLKWWAAQTLLYVRWNHPDSAGTNFKHEGTAYITNMTPAVAQGAAMSFSATFTGQGALTVV